MKRRALVALLGAGVPLAGCLGNSDATGEPGRQFTGSRPGECPVSRDYGVPLPDGVSVTEARSFVAGYEPKYVSDRLVDADGERASVGAEPSTTVRVVDAGDDRIVVGVETVWSVTVETENGEGVKDAVESARYYLDERVVRRTSDPDEDPVDGELVACVPA
ncbi:MULTISPECIES: hypothetical protein [Halorubrum]|uniref:Uncharacterized protein n=1 Tax=Halorubrum tropicale TaxID=1765655 RepID=A0A0M9ARM1_9EURY|nr:MULTISPECIES: hypothetical protein [Halorubrum]KOX96061.1 hypothetical protein AMR74_11005 [Halorubrum tropicale]TKX45945.1 hypothetical protein EXE50_01710 [Halorubrum sp. ARQ200]TKX51007.1 hypothetical protein EXE49_01945 [Halorubrum sp. ASP121]TKX61724.1 hypothetical protein EXE48_07960 [Halorubrum sp. ASP1]